MQLLLATRNVHKVREILDIFQIPTLDIMTILDRPDLPEVEETGLTFTDNAILKAVALARHAHMWTMADDSGLEVDALNGEPGVRSARYAGEPVDHAANIRKVLSSLEGVSDRRARFRCVIALSNSGGDACVVEGCCEGEIVDAPRGEGGFGYDPIFVPCGWVQTFAEMEPSLKNRISHRAVALTAARAAWLHALSCG